MKALERLLDALAPAALLLVVCAGISVAGDRHRTPAEIELRRTEIVRRLGALSDEEALIESHWFTRQSGTAPPSAETGRLVPQDPPDDIAARLQVIAAERATLIAENQGLSTVATRSATGPLSPADAGGLNAAQPSGGSGQVSAGTAFNRWTAVRRTGSASGSPG